MEVGVSRADDDAVVAVEQQEAIERVGPGLDREVEAEQQRAVENGGGRQAARWPVELDVALHPIDCAGQDGAEEQDQKQPVLDRDIGRQREEIEPYILAKDRIAFAVGHLVKEAQGHFPVRELDRSGQQAEQDRRAGDKKAGGNVRRHVAGEKLERGLLHSRRIGRRARRPRRRSTGEAERQAAREPEGAGRYGEDGEEEAGAGGEDRPEDTFIADRREPQPVDQGVARAPEQDHAHDDDRDQDRKVSPAHAAASFPESCIRPGYRPTVSSPRAMAKPPGLAGGPRTQIR